MINCMVIDDEQAAINIIASYIKNIPYLNLVAATTKPLEGLNIVNEGGIDLIFLDIQMPEITGLEFIKAINGRCRVILTTAYSEYAMDGYELSVIDYLLKPIPFSRFLSAAQKANEVFIRQNPAKQETSDTDMSEFILLKGEVKGKLVKIELSEIDYFEGMRNYVAVHYSGKKTMALINMKDLENRLPASKFIRVHKSFIVAISRIASIEGNNILLKNNPAAAIIIGNAYKPGFMDAIKTRLID